MNWEQKYKDPIWRTMRIRYLTENKCTELPVYFLLTEWGSSENIKLWVTQLRTGNVQNKFYKVLLQGFHVRPLSSSDSNFHSIYFFLFVFLDVTPVQKILTSDMLCCARLLWIFLSELSQFNNCIGKNRSEIHLCEESFLLSYKLLSIIPQNT